MGNKLRLTSVESLMYSTVDNRLRCGTHRDTSVIAFLNESDHIFVNCYLSKSLRFFFV